MEYPSLSWRIGDVKVSTVVEVQAPGLQFVLPEATPEACSRIPWLFPHFVTPQGDPIAAIQSYIVESQGKRIIVDTCIGNDKKLAQKFWAMRSGPFLHDLAEAGFPRESIDTVLCTHLHVDHIGWNTMLVNDTWVPTFPKADYLFGEIEWDHWQTSDVPGTEWLIEQSLQPILDAGQHTLVPTDHRITDEVTLEPTPGHTPGHVSVRIRSQGMEAVITGDLMHHPSQIVHPEWQCTFDSDPAQGCATRKAFVERHANTPVLILGTHYAQPSAGRIVRDGDSYRLVVE